MRTTCQESLYESGTAESQTCGQQVRYSNHYNTAPHKTTTAHKRRLPRDQEAWHFLSEGLGHVSAANVGNALEGKVDVDRITAGEVILDGLNH